MPVIYGDTNTNPASVFLKSGNLVPSNCTNCCGHPCETLCPNGFVLPACCCDPPNPNPQPTDPPCNFCNCPPGPPDPNPARCCGVIGGSNNGLYIDINNPPMVSGNSSFTINYYGLNRINGCGHIIREIQTQNSSISGPLGHLSCTGGDKTGSGVFADTTYRHIPPGCAQEVIDHFEFFRPMEVGFNVFSGITAGPIGSLVPAYSNPPPEENISITYTYTLGIRTGIKGTYHVKGFFPTGEVEREWNGTLTAEITGLRHCPGTLVDSVPARPIIQHQASPIVKAVAAPCVPCNYRRIK